MALPSTDRDFRGTGSKRCHLHKTASDERGYVLGMVMIFFIVFTILGLSFIKMAGFERLHASNYYMKTKAFYRAEAGIYKGLWRLNRISAAAASFADSTVTVVFDSTLEEMIAVGTAGRFLDSIRVSIVEDTSFIIKTWEE